MAESNAPRRRFREMARGADADTGPGFTDLDVTPQDPVDFPGWASEDGFTTRVEPRPDQQNGQPVTAPRPQPSRPARAQARQDVHDTSAFLARVADRQRSGEPMRQPKPLREVLDAFKGSPADQTRIQVLAAAATSRHLEGEQSPNAQRWEQLAQDNAARHEALRNHSQRHNQFLDQSEGRTPDEAAQRGAARTAAEAQQDKRVFDAAAAVAMGYVASKGLPPYDQLAELSENQLGPLPEPESTESPTAQTSRPAGPSTAQKTQDLVETAGRGIAQALGPVAGDDEVAPNLSPVDLTKLTQELLGALQAATSGHPRSIKEMLNVERAPDEDNEVAFAPVPELERDVEQTRDL
jgi:hypothetical protein